MYSKATPEASAAPQLLILNDILLGEYGLSSDWFRSPEGLAALSGTENNPELSVAMAYAGHQFANWVPLLGDGRAHMLGQLTTQSGQLLDVQLKGSGRTPYSRGGDGKATLSSALREYLISEAMAGLGIPTTRSLAVIGTGQLVQREQATAGGIVARTASSHIRVGSFQYAAASLEQAELQALADFMIQYHFPEIHEQDKNSYAGLIATAAERQAQLIAQWMLVGFIHGVMNTDNMSIVGETIDFGPCAFMDEFNPAKVFSSIDRQGRYAWNQQGSIGYWNLARFAETLLPLLDNDQDNAVEIAKQSLKCFEESFPNYFENGLCQKLGIDNNESTQSLIEGIWPLLGKQAIDFSQFFDRLTRVASGEADSLVLDLFTDKADAKTWLSQWREQLNADTSSMRQANPAIIARNHRVEEALEAAVEHDDWGPFERLSKALANPYQVDDADLELQEAPKPEERVTATFCGT